MIPLINRIADASDPTARVKVLVAELLRCATHPGLEVMLEEMDEKAAFIASAIVSGGHVHELAAVLEGRAAGL